MHRSETRELANCVVCGAEIAPATDRAYAAGPDSFLCFHCAHKRGGTYDEVHDRWDNPPSVGGLLLSEE